LPEPPAPAAAPQPVGLTPADVENVVQNSLPEMSPETLQTLLLLLRGVIDEKKG
jgi:hypothetical protein